MKSAINFKQPKYIIPLILFPFLNLFYYVFSQFGGKQKVVTKIEVADSTKINPTIQDVGNDIATNNLPDKFKAFQDTYKQDADSTAVKSLAPDNFQHSYQQEAASEQSRRFLDSMTMVMQGNNKEFEKKMKATRGLAGSNSAVEQVSPDKKKLNEMLNQLQSSGQAQGAGVAKKDQMELFRRQMLLMDSLQRARQEGSAASKKVAQQAPNTATDTTKALSVAKAGGAHRQAFNTVFANSDKNFITAIIDEETKSVEGSRLRFRLLDDIIVGDNQVIAKGTYIYGFVTGFSAQRLIVTITSINNNGQMLPVKLTIYDNDGLKGLYVPASNFRDFTKDLGAGSASAITYNSTSTSTDALSQITTGFIQQLFSGTTSAAQRLLKTNKATVKYSTIVYIVPEKH